MVGDYFTNDLLSGSPATSMFGNLINEAISSPETTAAGATLVIIMFLALLAPMLYYVRSTREEGL